MAQESAEGIVGRSCRSARAGHSPERGETARARTTGNERPKARTIGRVSRTRDSWVTCGRKSSSHWPSGRRVGVKPRMLIMKGPNHPWRSETPKARRPASHTAGRLTRSNRRGTDPYARWCGRGGVARLPLSRSTCFSAPPNTTALSRVPTTPWQYGEFDAQFVQPPPCPLRVAPSRQRVPALRPLNLPAGPFQQLPRRTRAQPPERDQRGDRRVDLALRQLRVFPPRIPAAPATGTGNSRS